MTSSRTSTRTVATAAALAACAALTACGSDDATPKPDEVTARCTGRGEELAVDITAPRGWNIGARHGSQILTVENTDQNLATADIDTTNKFLGVLQSVDWSETDQVDIAATTDAPTDWKPTHSGRVQLSIHVDCC